MSQKDKLLKRLLSSPSDFTFSEVETLLSGLGYKLMSKGKTSGSRVLFFRERDQHKIMLHKPHPGNILKEYAVKDLIMALRESGDING